MMPVIFSQKPVAKRSAEYEVAKITFVSRGLKSLKNFKTIYE
jgi:hypothetical protein